MRDYGPTFVGILSAAASALSEKGRGTALVHLAPGNEAAWDNCCEGGGQTYLRVGEIYPTAGQGSPFPNIDAAQRGVGCGVTLLALHLYLGVIRCAHTLDDHGTPPTATEMSDDALSALADMAILLDVISCRVPEVWGVQQVKVGQWTPQGVLGGCAGGEWEFYVAVDPCIDCSEPAAAAG